MTNSVKAWEGPSEINGEPIFCLITAVERESKNTKTGDMLQVATMHATTPPQQAANEGLDESVCGNCKLRPILSDERPDGLYSCYVKKWRMKALWAFVVGLLVLSWKAVEDVLTSTDKAVRFGMYGNMSSMPKRVAKRMLLMVKRARKKWTLYEHLWREARNQWLAEFAMASVESLEEKEEAKALGWRTFRQLKPGEEMQSDEVMCPFVTKSIQCKDCRLCSGNSIGAKSVAIPSHT